MTSTPGPQGHGPTTLSTPPRPGSSGGGRSAVDSDIVVARFAPGTVLAGRFRILSLLGRGGMGEVYRADDLTLGQQVALKFLPESLASDPAGLASFHNEVRLARQIAHPNICRVYDIGTIDGANFLSMEYVDGEDLASLHRRIGRLPADKALEIARQLCAGLHAAHAQGVLHRDLKPANVMIDGRGQARIMDFGLAGVADRLTEADVFAGTPSNMAPEQLAGIEVTVRSDIYALGLVLYEMVTGHPAFRSDSLVELIQLHQETPPRPPSESVPDLDPRLERAILSCLAKNPAVRPQSALAVTALLPGGDPLAEALAAGKTPSPEMVAAAGEQADALPLRSAWLALAGLLVLLAVCLVAADRATLHRRMPLSKSPPVLVDRAQELLRTLGIPAGAGNRGHGFNLDQDYLRWAARRNTGASRWDGIDSGRDPVVTFWYRENARMEVTWDFGRLGVMSAQDPPWNQPGNALVWLRADGHLNSLTWVPPLDDTLAVLPPVNWHRLFAAAGLDTARFQPATAPLIPRVFADDRRAWRGTVAGDTTTLIVQAASLRGHPVQFRVIHPWELAAGRNPAVRNAPTDLLNRILTGLLLGTLIIGGFALGIRNARSKAADFHGARRLAWAAFWAVLAAWAIGAPHHSDPNTEVESLAGAMAGALLQFGFFYGAYLALEPTVRRVWPQLLIGWTRLLSGRLRDPRVGRDILVASGFGLGLTALRWILIGAAPALGFPPPTPQIVAPETLLGPGRLIMSVLTGFFQIVQTPLVILMFIVVIRSLLKGPRAAIAISIAIFLAVTLLNTTDPFRRIEGLIMTVASFYVLLRFGFLPLTVMMTVMSLLSGYPVTMDATAWYAPSGFSALILILLTLGYGFWTAIGRQKPFGRGVAAG